jgi:hypothetical protein
MRLTRRNKFTNETALGSCELLLAVLSSQASCAVPIHSLGHSRDAGFETGEDATLRCGIGLSTKQTIQLNSQARKQFKGSGRARRPPTRMPPRLLVARGHWCN